MGVCKVIISPGWVEVSFTWSELDFAFFPSCGSCQVLVHYSAARAKSPSHRQAGMFPANGEERSSPLYLLKGINGQD